MTDLKQFTPKNKPTRYIRAFVEFYNWRKCRQVHEIHEMIELKKMHALTVENPYNLIAHRIIVILLVLHSAHVIPRDLDKFLYYINNYNDCNQFNQLYDLNWIEKGIKNINTVVRKLGPALTRAPNYRLEVTREERRKRDEMVERRKIEAKVIRR